MLPQEKHRFIGHMVEYLFSLHYFLILRILHVTVLYSFLRVLMPIVTAVATEQTEEAK